MEKMRNAEFRFPEGMNSEKIIGDVVDSLCRKESYASVYHRSGQHDDPMPSVELLKEIVGKLKSIIFPGYFLYSDLKPGTMKYYLGSALDWVVRSFSEQIRRGFCFSCTKSKETVCHECNSSSRIIMSKFIQKLPDIRHMLSLDAEAAYEGDPAANSIGEVIFSYPSMVAMTHHRIAHELYKLEVPLIPRIISELAHSETGIDINPGATIGKGLFIDHGTGTVIGETCIIGDNVRIYQGVTLGAKKFPLDGNGNPIKGIPRHPIVEDDVIIYSGATILGRVTIGKGAEIGGNVWVTTDVAPGTRILQQKASEIYHSDGSGI